MKDIGTANGSRRLRAQGGTAGFTLMELMMVITVLAILVVATAASLGVFSPRASRAELHDATTDLLDRIEFARLRAAMTNKAVELRLINNGDTTDLVLLDHQANHCLASSNPAMAPPRQILRVPYTSNIRGERGWVGGEQGRPKFSEVAMTALLPQTLGTNNGLCFRPDGRVTEANGTLFQPDPATQLAAGEASVTLRMRVEQDLPKAIEHEVIVPYNGLAKVRYNVP